MWAGSGTYDSYSNLRPQLYPRLKKRIYENYWGWYDATHQFTASQEAEIRQQCLRPVEMHSKILSQNKALCVAEFFCTCIACLRTQVQLLEVLLKEEEVGREKGRRKELTNRYTVT